MSFEAVARRSRHDREIGLGLGVGIDGNGPLGPDHPPGSKYGPQRIQGQTDGDHVRRALGLGDDQLAADALDGLVLVEDAQIDPWPSRARP